VKRQVRVVGVYAAHWEEFRPARLAGLHGLLTPVRPRRWREICRLRAGLHAVERGARGSAEPPESSWVEGAGAIAAALCVRDSWSWARCGRGSLHTCPADPEPSGASRTRRAIGDHEINILT